MWYKEISKDSDVVISSRIRLARNIKGYNFENILKDKEKESVINYLENVVKNTEYKLLKMSNIDDITKLSLVEQHIISKEFVTNELGAIITNDDSSLVTMINEEDHLRMQAFMSGFNINSCYKKIKSFEEKLGESIEYIKSDKYGYLCSCPTNVGSGMRASVLLHLPGLSKVGLLNKVLDQVSSIGISVRGLYGENTNSEGYIYQISNQKTLGISDENIISNMEAVVSLIIEQERKAREVLKSRKKQFEDEIFRAYGTLKYARIMSDDEALKLLSKVRLGVSMDIIKDIKLEVVQRLMIECMTNTLKLINKQNYSKKEELIKRSEYIRKELK